MTRDYLTPPEIGRMLRVDVGQVHGWIRSGELPAYDLSARRGSRPRWKVMRADLDAFLLRRRAQAPAPRVRRRRKPATPIVEYV
ncbi:MAG: helix-turn-helix domain-containing protein [Planctomycetes bacterium]|nr:helix-turn-helix domain-containing protein [Planctomycetota bacterium]